MQAVVNLCVHSEKLLCGLGYIPILSIATGGFRVTMGTVQVSGGIIGTAITVPVGLAADVAGASRVAGRFYDMVLFSIHLMGGARLIDYFPKATGALAVAVV